MTKDDDIRRLKLAVIDKDAEIKSRDATLAAMREALKPIKKAWDARTVGANPTETGLEAHTIQVRVPFEAIRAAAEVLQFDAGAKLLERHREELAKLRSVLRSLLSEQIGPDDSFPAIERGSRHAPAFDLDAKDAEIAAMREALEPFAAWSRRLTGPNKLGDRCMLTTDPTRLATLQATPPHHVDPTISDLRKAEAALQSNAGSKLLADCAAIRDALEPFAAIWLRPRTNSGDLRTNAIGDVLIEGAYRALQTEAGAKLLERHREELARWEKACNRQESELEVINKAHRAANQQAQKSHDAALGFQERAMASEARERAANQRAEHANKAYRAALQRAVAAEAALAWAQSYRINYEHAAKLELEEVQEEKAALLLRAEAAEYFIQRNHPELADCQPSGILQEYPKANGA